LEIQLRYLTKTGKREKTENLKVQIFSAKVQIPIQKFEKRRAGWASSGKIIDHLPFLMEKKGQNKHPKKQEAEV